MRAARGAPALLGLWGLCCELPDDVIARLQTVDVDAGRADAGGEPLAPELPSSVPTLAQSPRPEPATCADGCGGGAECPCNGERIRLTTAGGANFQIDATEVTVAEYARFLEHARAPTPIPPDADAGALLAEEHQCAWNETHTPAVTSYDLDSRCQTDFDFERFLREVPDFPLVCVDWCDARDYCRWNGGHLCGALSGGRLTNATAGTLEDSWYSACSAGGTRAYAYGNPFDPVACNTGNSGNNSSAIPVASIPSCEGPEPGLFDMNGNADEWVDYCEPDHPRGQTEALCFRVGGAFFQDGADQSRCDSILGARRSTVGNNTGLRCCYP